LETHSQKLRWKIELVRPRLRTAAGRVWNHARLVVLFPDLLFTTHSVIRATVPTIKAALQCAKDRAPKDPVCAGMVDYLAAHAQEEKDHDEWTLDDLEALGVRRDEVWKRIPSPAVAALAGSQYYWIHHFHPVAYLSYQAIMERPPSPEFLEQCIERTGLPREAFATQFFHGKVDPHHVAEFDRMVDALPLDAWHHSVMGVNVVHSVELLARVYDDLLERFEANRTPVPRPQKRPR
jgi:hypothetical protein